MRHTRPVLGKGYCYGSTDIALAQSFEKDAERAIARLPIVERIVSSPLTRAHMLAERIASQRNLALVVEPRVTEFDFGAWEGRLWSEIPRHELDAWAADFLDARPHGGESVRGFRSRCLAALRDYAEHPGDTLVVCHAGVVRAAFARGADSRDFATPIGYGECMRWPE
ncbi:MAG: histidine phosphatase family protein [Pseudomonadota bacterium]